MIFLKNTNTNIQKKTYNLKLYKLTDIVSVEFGDFYDFIKGGFEFDMAHIDISNTGEIIEKVIKAYPDKTILFEGGSKERDNNKWMTKYKAKTINPIPKTILNGKYPSISLIKK